MSRDHEEGARQAAIGVLRARGYDVQLAGTGRGVARSARLRIRTPAGEEQNCVVKVTTDSGRISFVYGDGRSGKTWGPLTEMDSVLYVHAPLSGAVRVQMFKRKVIEDAFNKLHAALEAEGRGHIPHWLAPFREEGLRFTGSGFGDQADWTVDLKSAGRTVASPTMSPVKAPAALEEAIAQAKGIIAKAIGRSPTDINLTISFSS